MIIPRIVSCVFRRVKDHHNSLHCAPLLKKPRVRQGVLDKWFPLNIRKAWETEPTQPNRTEPNRLIPEPTGTGCETEPNRTEPDRATVCPKNASRTASNREQYISEPNRTEPINFRKVWNRNESNRTVSFLEYALGIWPIRLTCPVRLTGFAALFATFEQTCVRQVALDKRFPPSSAGLARLLRRRGHGEEAAGAHVATACREEAPRDLHHWAKHRNPGP